MGGNHSVHILDPSASNSATMKTKRLTPVEANLGLQRLLLSPKTLVKSLLMLKFRRRRKKDYAYTHDDVSVTKR